MPLPLPNLDTKCFDDLVAEMRDLIPQYAPDWTNHNPSDPGMTLIELFAWVTEATLYRLNAIPETTYLKFIMLLLGGPPDLGDRLELAKLKALRNFNEPYRVITAADFNRAAKQVDQERIARVEVFTNNLEGRVTVVVVPKESEAFAELLASVAAELNSRKLIGTRLFVRGAHFMVVDLDIQIVLKSNVAENIVRSAVEGAILKYLNPITGWVDGGGWPFGRSLSIFELFRLVESVAGVDHVEAILMKENDVVKEKEITVPELLRLNPPTIRVVR